MHITAVSVDNFRCILCPFLYGGVGFKIAFGFCPVNDFFSNPVVLSRNESEGMLLWKY